MDGGKHKILNLSHKINDKKKNVNLYKIENKKYLKKRKTQELI